MVDLLPDRQANTVAEWLRDHAPPEVISRDCAGAYAEAARLGAPHAVQVADRFHLIRNLREALEHVLARHGAIIEEPFRRHTPAPVTDAPPTPANLAFDTFSATQPRAERETPHALSDGDRVTSAWHLNPSHRIPASAEPENRTRLVAPGTIS